MLRELKPRFLEKVWGSEHLDPLFPNKGAKIGEVWFEARTGPTGTSIPPGAGQGAAESGSVVRASYMESPADFPLLIKFLFTTEPLSVQVHPNDAYAAEHHNSRGKTEMWHVLAAEPGAKIAAGFREPISEEHLRAAALSGEIEELLAWYEAHPGDTFFIPAGTVHAIGAGLTLCEIQQLSDITYRLYDYGRPRELHLDHSVAVSHLKPHSARKEPEGELLVSCEYFTVTRHECSGTLKLPSIPDLIVVIDGKGTIASTEVHAGQVWQAMLDGKALEVSGKLTLLAVSV
jgi:mannose-6-phosphate isomerase